MHRKKGSRATCYGKTAQKRQIIKDLEIRLVTFSQYCGKTCYCGGGVAEWFRALDLKSGGPWFPDLFLVVPSSTPPPRCC